MTTMTLTWKRATFGYLRSDGAWFLERGARMSDTGNNAWLIYRRVDEPRIGRDSHKAYDLTNGLPLWTVGLDGLTDIADADFTGDLYAHDYDAGSLAEAKAATQAVEAREATR